MDRGDTGREACRYQGHVESKGNCPGTKLAPAVPEAATCRKSHVEQEQAKQSGEQFAHKGMQLGHPARPGDEADDHAADNQEHRTVQTGFANQLAPVEAVRI